MADRRVRISYGRTCQNAPYESIRLDVSIEKSVYDNESMTETIDKTTNGLVLYVKSKIAKILQGE